MKSKLPLWIRSLLFLVAFGLLYHPVQKMITNAYVSEVYVVERMIEDQEDFDILIMGSSHGYCSFNPKILDTILVNSNTKNLSIPNQNFAHIAILLQQIVEEGKSPNILILESYSITPNMYGPIQISFFNAYSKTWEPDYLFQIANYYPINDLIYPFVPLINQHENWKSSEIINTNLKRWDDRRKIVEREIKINPGYQNAGFRPYPQTITAEDYQDAINHPTSFIPKAENLLALERILSIAEENNIQVIFVTAPYPKAIHGDFSQLDQIIQMNELTHYNFNEHYSDHFIPLHYVDQNHLNEHGAVNATLFLADILSAETDRELLTEKRESFSRLNLAELRIEEVGQDIVVTLVPADGISEFQVDWQLKTNKDDELMSQTGGGMQFSFPAVLMNLSELDLLFTYQVPGFDYSITVQQNLTH